MTDTAVSGAPTLDPRSAAVQLESLGFLAHADLPDGPGDASLLVAIRDRPTNRHFDPEQLDVWVSRGSRGEPLTITRRTPLPIDRPFSWGGVRITDRFGISNEYVTFGGRLQADVVDDATICVLTSPAPLLRRGGHSQGFDPSSDDLAAFFGRMMVAVDYTPGFEARLAQALPEVRYAAFVADFTDRYRSSPTLRTARPDTWALLRAEEGRLEARAPEAWRAGRSLLAAATLPDAAPSPR